MRNNIILLGPPGSGKGTQSEKIILSYDYVHISTGDIIRQNIKKGTKYGRLAKKYSEKGKLIPDNIIIEMVEKHLATITSNIIWDGFPRTINQAKKLDELLAKLGTKIHYTLYFKIDEKKLVKRITERLICSKCNKIYNICTLPSKMDGICDYDQTELLQRKDDTIDKIKIRLESYQKYTFPLIGYYSEKQCLFVIDANMEDNTVWNQIVAIINQ